MAVGTTYRVLRQAAYAEVQRLWGEWRVRGESRPRRPAARRAARKATVEALEPRQMLSVTASAWGASHVTAGSTYQLNLSASATVGSLTGWSIIWGDGFCGTAASTATAAFHTYASATNSVGISATAADLETGVSHYCTAFTSVAVDASGTSGAHISGNSATEGACLPYTLYPSFCDVNGRQASTWAAYWGDSSPSSTYSAGQTAITHAYSEPGCYPVTLVAYDADYSGGPLSSAGSYSSTTNVTISEATPYFGACGSGSVAEGSLYAVYESFCDPGLDNLFSWAAWWGDGASTTNISASASSATHSYTETGSYCVTLVAFDEDHSTGSSTWAAPSGYCTSIVVNVCEAAATVQVGGGGLATVTEGVAYTMHLTFSDPGLDQVNYWHVDWGDTSSSFYAGALTALTHNYANEPGAYTVTVQAYDEDEPSTQAWGASAYTSSVHLTVAEAAQSPWINVPSSILPHNTYNYTLGIADPGGDLATYTIDWGDGTTSFTTVAGSSAVFAHSYASNSTYNMTVTAVDEDGAYNGNFVAVVSDVPTASAYGDNGGGSVVEGSSYKLQATFNDLAGHIASSWVIHWGDNQVDTEMTAAGPFYHTYSEASNSYLIQAIAYDIDGAATINVNASIVEGTASAVAWGAAAVFESSSPNYTLNFGFTDPAENPSGWWVIWGDNTPPVFYGGAPSTAAHAYTEPGTYHPEFVAIDEDHPAASWNSSDGSYSCVTTVTVSETTPFAGILGSSTVMEGSPYQIAAVFHDDGGDVVTEWRVDWGDTHTNSGLNPACNIYGHAYTQPGDYTFTATAVYEDGTTMVAQLVHVKPLAPLLQIQGATSVAEGADYTLNLFGAFPADDHNVVEDGSSLTWHVDWGDGQGAPDVQTFDGAVTAQNETHAYTQAGPYVLTATAVDDHGVTWGPVVLNGQLDVGFGSSATPGIVMTDFGGRNDQGRSVALQSDGAGGFNIIAAGISYNSDDTTSLALARYSATGVLDTSFGPPASGGKVLTTFGGADAGAAITVQSDGSIFVAGQTATGQFAITRFSSDGIADGSFGSAGVATTHFSGTGSGVTAMALQNIGNTTYIVVAGTINGNFALARYTTQGILDASGTGHTGFGDGTGEAIVDLGGWEMVHGLAIDPSGNIVVSGESANQFALARFNASGALGSAYSGTWKVVTPLAAGSSLSGAAVAIQSDGNIVVAGTAYSSNSVDFIVARYTPAGMLDSSFHGNGPTPGMVTTGFAMGAWANAIALESNASGQTTGIVVAGQSAGQIALARYVVADGKPDRTFGVNGTLLTAAGDDSSAAALLVQPDGKILLAGTAQGNFLLLNSTDFALTRYLQNDSLQVVPSVVDLTATAASTTEIDLTWSSNDTGVSSIEVYTSTDGLSFHIIAQIVGNPNYYAATGLSANTPYWFRVREILSPSATTADASVNAWTLPATPVAVAVSQNEVDVSWSAIPNATHYEVFRSADPSFQQGVHDVGTAAGTALNDTAATAGTAYYRVQGYAADNTPVGMPQDGSATISASAQLPQGLGNVGLAVRSFQPIILSDLSSLGPTDFTGGVVAGGDVGSFGSRFWIYASVSSNSSDIQGDNVPVTRTWSDSSGTYILTVQGKSTHSQGSIAGNGTWSYSEKFSTTYSAMETFLGVGGNSWHLTQDGSDVFTLAATGNALVSRYKANEQRSDSFQYDATSGTGLFIHLSSQGGTQAFDFNAAGTRNNNSDNTYTTSEIITYNAQGTNTATDSDHEPTATGTTFTSNSPSSQWTYLSIKDAAQAANGGDTSTESFTFDQTGHRPYENDKTQSSDVTNSDGGRTTETSDSGSTMLAGSEDTKVHVGGAAVSFANGTLATSVSHTYSDKTIDDSTSTDNQSQNVTGNISAGVTITSAQSSQSSSKAHRDFEQSTSGSTNKANGFLTFNGKTNGLNLVTSSWDVTDTNHSEGTDTSSPGTARSSLSDHDAHSWGGGDYSFVSNGSETIDVAGLTAISGTSTTTDTETQNSHWNNSDSSKLDSDVITGADPHYAETSIHGTDSATDIGDGKSLDFATGTAIQHYDGSSSTSGSSTHHAESKGQTTEDHNYSTDSNTVDTATPNVTTTTTSSGTHVSTSPGSYTAGSDGNGTYNNNHSSTTLTNTRGTTGTSKVHDTEDDQTVVDDTNTTGLITNSKATTNFTHDFNGSTQDDYTDTTNTTDGATTSASSKDLYVEGGTSEAHTVDDSKSTVGDFRDYYVDITTKNTAHSQKDSAGAYTDTKLATSATGGDGRTRSTHDEKFDDKGTYIESGNTTVSSSTDDYTEISATKSNDTDSEAQIDGNGTYEDTRENSGITAADGSYTSSATTSATSAGSGTSSSDGKTVDMLYGTEGLGTNVYRYVDSTVTSTENDKGTYSSDSSDSSDTEVAAGQSTFSSTHVDNREDKGDTKTDTTVIDTTTVHDDSTANVSKVDTNKTNSDDSATGIYDTTAYNSSQTENGGTGTDAKNKDVRSGTSKWTKSTTTSSDSTDTTVDSIIKTAHSESADKEDGTGKWSSSADSRDQSFPDHTTSSTANSTSDSTTDGTTTNSFKMHGETHEEKDDSAANQWTETIADSTADDKKLGGGTFHNVAHAESHGVDGKTDSLSTSEHDEAGSFSQDTSKDTTGTVDETDYNAAGKTTDQKNSFSESHSKKHADANYSSQITHGQNAYKDGSWSTSDTENYDEYGGYYSDDHGGGYGDDTDTSVAGVTKHGHSTNGFSTVTSNGQYHDTTWNENDTLRRGSMYAEAGSSHDDQADYTYGKSNNSTSTLTDKSIVDNKGTPTLVKTATTTKNYAEDGGGHYDQHNDDNTVDTGDGAPEYEAHSTRNDKGDLGWSNDDSNNSQQTDTQTAGITKTSHDVSSDSEDCDGPYSSKSKSDTADGTTISSDASETDGKGGFTADDKVVYTYVESTVSSSGVHRTANANETKTSKVSNGNVEVYTSSGHYQSPSSTTSYQIDSREEEADLATSDINHQEGHENSIDIPTGATKSSDTVNDSNDGNTGHYTSTLSTGASVDNGDPLFIKTDQRSESGTSTWQSSSNKDTTAKSTSLSSQISPSSTHDHETDNGSGTYSLERDFTTTTQHGSDFHQGSSTSKVNGSGNTTWDKGGSNGTNYTVATLYGSRTTDVTTTNSDTGSGNYTLSTNVSLTYDQNGVGANSGSVERVETDKGNTLTNKTGSWTDSSHNTSVPGIDITYSHTYSLGGGTTGDYNNTTDNTITINADGSQNPTTVTTNLGHTFTTRTESITDKNTRIDTTQDGLTVTTVTTNSSTDFRKSGTNVDRLADDSGTTTVRSFTHTNSLRNETKATTVAADYTTVDDTVHTDSTSDNRTRTDTKSYGITTRSYGATDTVTTDDKATSDFTSAADTTHTTSDSGNVSTRTENRDAKAKTGTITEDISTYSNYERIKDLTYLDGTTGHYDHSQNASTALHESTTINDDGTTILNVHTYNTNSTFDDSGHGDYGGSGEVSVNGAWTFDRGQTNLHVESLSGSQLTTTDTVNYWNYANGQGTKTTDGPNTVTSDYAIANREQLVLLGSDFGEEIASVNDAAINLANQFNDTIYGIYQGLITITVNPVAFVDGLAADTYQFFADGSAADTFYGWVDGTVQALNPLDNWFHVPEIGPVYGHADLYGYGHIAGTITGIAANILIGNVAAGGLVGCGSLLQQAASFYSEFSAVAGVVGAVEHVIEGKAGLGDALAFLPVVSWGVSTLSGLSNCFTAGTEVATAPDPAHPGVFSDKPIQDIQVGDEVLTRDQNNPNAPLEERKVVQLFRHTVTELEDVTILGSDGKQETIRCTTEHPFYVQGLGWTGSSHLLAGEKLLEPDGTEAVVVSTGVEEHPEGVTVYNFEVEGDHTYFVDAGGADVWVHNQCQINVITGTGSRIEEAFAHITAADIGTGTSTTEAARRLARSLGRADDDAGHVISRLLGGRGGSLSKNIFPQAVSINRGQFATFEKGIANIIRATGQDGYVLVRLVYAGNSTRPNSIEYLAQIGQQLIYSHFLNP